MWPRTEGPLHQQAAVVPPCARRELDISEIQAFRALMDTKYAALYYPWINVRNPSTSRFETVATSGHMAGLYARVDTERGVHKAPANEVIRGIRLPGGHGQPGGIAQDITKREQDLLNPRGINALRYFPGRGQRVWGARTLTSDSAWKYVNVRRILIFVEASIDRGTQWVVFEPNEEGTWARVRQTIRNFLITVWRSGALEGLTEEEAFFVRCDPMTAPGVAAATTRQGPTAVRGKSGLPSRDPASARAGRRVTVPTPPARVVHLFDGGRPAATAGQMPGHPGPASGGTPPAGTAERDHHSVGAGARTSRGPVGLCRSPLTPS